MKAMVLKSVVRKSKDEKGVTRVKIVVVQVAKAA
jgi:hypothetical protein